MIVLDASALLAFLFRERGHGQVADVLDDCCMSTVNLSEVIGRFVRDGHSASVVLQRLLGTPIEFVSFTEDQAALTAQLIPSTRALGLSFGDRACLALAMARGLQAMTADQAWEALNIGVAVHVIR
ncbi:MAG: type II toxin-antitoxin system VapC family toxin [Anaerolineae bacterium]|nr:type II toxin-antitoxin system VapC family toxin [Candidatus Roseilinea sp.]MDW8450799.1 type II toxin-antitoxin system VapC family toxin [Anaerolineae bacterium]